MADATLADRLYEAAFVPELWSEACEGLAQEVQSDTAAIFTVDPAGDLRYVSTPNVYDLYGQFAVSEHRHQNIRAQKALERSPFVFGRDIDILTEEEMRQDTIAPTFIYPNGMRWEAGCVFQEPTGHIVATIMMRAEGREHFSDTEIARMNDLKPDLARAAYMASRTAFRQAQSMTEAMSMLNLPAVVIGDSGRAITMNPEMETLSPRIRTGAGDRLVLEGRGASALLDEAIERYRAQAIPQVQSLPMASRDGAPPLVLHLLPVRRAARDIFSRSLAILAVTAVGQIGSPDMRVLSGLFDLTPAEARIARAVAMAQTPEAIAASIGIAQETVRSHLKKIMQKTGTTRQAELVLLLSGLSAPQFNGAGRGGDGRGV